MTKKTPPQEFANALAAQCKDCPVDGWNKLPEWEMFKRGYNACVAKVNAKTLERYDVKTNAERMFR